MDRKLFELKGRVAVVTGASSGIGKAIGEALAAYGASVVLVGRDRARLEEAGQSIRSAGGAASSLPADLLDRASVDDCIESASKPFGAPDILVNAAGMNRRKPTSEVSDADWDDIVTLNLKVPFLLARGLVPGMKEKGWGRIINVSSLQSVRASPNSMAYGAAKAGVVQLTRSMAEEWSRYGIGCNAIAPGLFPTRMTENLYADAELVKNYESRTAVGRAGRVEDVWGLAIFLAAPASDYVTGQTIFLDGGYTAK